MLIFNKYLPLLGSLILVFNVGCAENNFSSTQAQKAFVQDFSDSDDADFGAGTPPVAIAYGGFLQFDYYDLSKSDEHVMGVESLIGQPIMAKVHKKNGVRVEVGYPGLQSHFAVE